jgi:hypothetical protein
VIRYRLPDVLGGAECTFHAKGYQPGCWIVELVDVMPGLRIEIEPEALTEVPPATPAEPEPGAYLNDDEAPRAEIEQTGRWTYRITVHHGMIQWGLDGVGWTAFGRKRAERKARKVLRKYLQRQAWQGDRWAVEP